MIRSYANPLPNPWCYAITGVDMPKSQTGLVLIASLLMLLIISLLALGIGGSALEGQRQANRHFTKVLAYNTADSALAAAEADLWNHRKESSWLMASTNITALDSSHSGSWWLSTWSGLSAVHTLTGYTHGKGMYRIERRQFIPINASAGQNQGVTLFRITSRGEGPDYDSTLGGGLSFIQSHFALFTTAQSQS